MPPSVDCWTSGCDVHSTLNFWQCDMQLEATTWSRDSHELFDYESRSVERICFSIDSSVRVYRRGVSVIVGPDIDGGMEFSVIISIFTLFSFRTP